MNEYEHQALMRLWCEGSMQLDEAACVIGASTVQHLAKSGYVTARTTYYVTEKGKEALFGGDND